MENSGAFGRKNVLRGRTVGLRLADSPWVVAVARALPGEKGGSFLHRRIVLQLGTEIWVVADALSEQTAASGEARAEPRDARRSVEGSLHRLDALVHTPFSTADASAASASRLEIRVPGRDSSPGTVAIERVAMSGGVGRGDGTEFLTAADDERTWYSPWFSELRHGVTVHTWALFADSIAVVHAITREGARVEAVAVGTEPLRLTAHAGGASRSLSIAMDPIAIELDGAPLELSRGDATNGGWVQP
jgi:hypothetical protein